VVGAGPFIGVDRLVLRLDRLVCLSARLIRLSSI
jgi:hypothetical protein